MVDHAFQHLGSGNHRLAGMIALTDDPFLQQRHLFFGDLHPQIAPRNHNSVGYLQDLLKIGEAAVVLDLGDDLRFAALFFQKPAQLQDIIAVAGEGDRNIMYAQR